MKNIKLILVFLVALFVINVSNVDAAEIGDRYILTSSKSYANGVTLPGGKFSTSDGYWSPQYTASNGDSAYCLDPNESPGNLRSLTVKEEITDNGILLIIQNGGSNYMATLIALRAYVNSGHSSYSATSGTFDTPALGAHQTLAKSWGGTVKASDYNFSVSATGQTLIDEAKRLYEIALGGGQSTITAYLLTSSTNGGQRYVVTGEPIDKPDEISCPTTFNMPTTCVDPYGTYQEEDVVGNITGPTDIENCIVGQDGRKYNCEPEVANNDYCAVYCKEDYSEIRYSGAQDVNSGRYFQVTAKVSGVKTCYTDKIDLSAFESDINAYSTEYQNAYNEYQSALSLQSSLPGQITSQTNALNSATSTTRPTIQTNIDSLQTQLDAANNTVNNIESTFATIQGKINNAITQINGCTTWSGSFETIPEVKFDYAEGSDFGLSEEDKIMNANLTPTGSTASYCRSVDSNYNCTSATSSTKSYTYNVCTTTGCTRTGNTGAISQALYAIKSNSKTIDYTSKTVFATEFPTGNVIYNPEGLEGNNQEQINGWPVSLETDTGQYQFTFNITDLGEYSDCTPGRLDDDKDNNSEYICYYKVNCPDCAGEYDFNVPPICPNCIFQFGKIQLYFRTISTDAFNPNDRELGYNYSVEDIKYGFISAKALETLNGTDGPNNDSGILVGDPFAGDPTLSVTLTPGLANEIRRYNDQAKSYTNNTLECEDYSADYKNIFCYSTVLSEWVDNFSDEFVFVDNRNDVDEYWTIFNENLPVQSPDNIGGPSWK